MGPFVLYAQELLRTGYRPIPTDGKVPLLKKWPQYRLPYLPLSKHELQEPNSAWDITPALLQEWMQRYPTAGLGVAHGTELVGVDVDHDDLVAGVLAALPPTCCKVGRKGFTALYRNPHSLRSEDFCLPGGVKILQILGQGRKSAIPPTIHPDTHAPYRWINPWTGASGLALWECGALPAFEPVHRWRLERLAVAHGALDPFLRWAAAEQRRREGVACDPATAADINVRRPKYEAYARKAVRNEASELAATGEGGRNGALFQAAAAVGRFVSRALLTEADVMAALLEACRINGLLAEDGERACLETIKSGLQAGSDDSLMALPSEEAAFKKLFPDPAVLPEGASASPVAEPAPHGHAHLDDYWAILPDNKILYAPTGALWPPESADKSLAWVETGGIAPSSSGGVKLATMRPSKWLALNRPIKQLLWHPSEPQIVRGRLLREGGWVEKAGDVAFNTYNPPVIRAGRGEGASKWVSHIETVYPSEAAHILAWMAFKVQHPGVKVNHAIVLGGAGGIGKDTMLRPLLRAVGEWNMREASPREIVGSQNNGYLQCVILRISEVRDLGEASRFAFFEQMKTAEAAPPEVHSVVDKWVKAHPVANVCGVIYTTNHKEGGMHLEADDRRHFVAWSDLTKDDFTDAYWKDIHAWLDDGGIDDCAAYLRDMDLTAFNSKAPPPLTDAFWAMVEANRPESTYDLAELVSRIGNPDALTLLHLEAAAHGDAEMLKWLKAPSERKKISRGLADIGYEAVRNPADKTGRWKIGGRRMSVYVKKSPNLTDRLEAVKSITTPPTLH